MRTGAASGADLSDGTPRSGAAVARRPASTEGLAPGSRGLDTCGGTAVLERLFEGQKRALAAVEAAIPAIERAVDLAVAALARGGRLVYLAAGSPALIALADSLEMPQTYGERPEDFVTVPAGGLDLVTNFCGVPEDDENAARRDVAAAGLDANDCLVAISASGSTPFVVAGLEAARAAGASTVAIANNAGAPILGLADVAVLLETGPEVVAGSTRMGAGTAQKAVLNMLSTAVAVRRGHVHDGHMVSVRADNAKLRRRALGMIRAVAGVSESVAAEALDRAGGEVKPAILLAAGTKDLDTARARLAAAGGHLRQALEAPED